MSEPAGRTQATEPNGSKPKPMSIFPTRSKCSTSHTSGAHVRDAVRAIQPGRHAARRAWRKAQYEVLLPLLWHGEREQALAHLHSLCPPTGEVPPPLEEAIRYLETQRNWLGNYEQWQADGYPVGSGLVERAVAVVINMRMKKRGMRWKRTNATAVVTLRVQRINAGWEDAPLSTR